MTPAHMPSLNWVEPRKASVPGLVPFSQTRSFSFKSNFSTVSVVLAAATAAAAAVGCVSSFVFRVEVELERAVVDSLLADTVGFGITAAGGRAILLGA